MSYVKFERALLKGQPQFSERWVQDRIAEDPSLLGLGDVILKDKERLQPRAAGSICSYRAPTPTGDTKLRFSLERPTNHTSR